MLARAAPPPPAEVPPAEPPTGGAVAPPPGAAVARLVAQYWKMRLDCASMAEGVATIPSMVHKVMRVATGNCLMAVNEYTGESSHRSAAQNSLYTPTEPVC